MPLQQSVGSWSVIGLLGASCAVLGCNSSKSEGGESSKNFVGCQAKLGVEHKTIDSDFTGDNKALGDVDGDGVLDVIVGGALLKWYAAPDFAPREIPGSGGELAQHMEAADVNDDGAVDIITPDGYDIYWFENPRGGGGSVEDEWPKHLIGNQGRPAHEVDLGDFDGDGRLDVATNPTLNVWLQREQGAAWTKLELNHFSNTEGMSVGRIDGDDRPDIAVKNGWIRTPDDATDVYAYELFTIEDVVNEHVTIKVADVNDDGRSEVIHAPKGVTGEILVYSAEDPSGVWTPLSVAAAGGIHDYVVVDMDRDGLKELVFAEMADSLDKRVGVFRRAEVDWTLEVFATTGSHNIVVGDVDGDCDLDIAGSNWQSPPVEIWLNTLCRGGASVCE